MTNFLNSLKSVLTFGQSSVLAASGVAELKTRLEGACPSTNQVFREFPCAPLQRAEEEGHVVRSIIFKEEPLVVVSVASDSQTGEPDQVFVATQWREDEAEGSTIKWFDSSDSVNRGEVCLGGNKDSYADTKVSYTIEDVNDTLRSVILKLSGDHLGMDFGSLRSHRDSEAVRETMSREALEKLAGLWKTGVSSYEDKLMGKKDAEEDEEAFDVFDRIH